MKVGFVQLRPVFEEKKRNVEKSLKFISKADADLLVFPELCNTGYVFKSIRELRKLAESVPDGDTTQEWVRSAREHGLYVVAGILERAEGSEEYYNSAVVIGPEGFVGVYRKAHLFSEEKRWFNPGNTGFCLFDLGGVKVGVMICFDWIFPEAARTLALNGAEIICHPANLILPYCQQVMRARAVENRVFTVTANRVGTERGLRFTGNSLILSPEMKVLAKASRDRQEMRIVKIDPKKARNKNVTRANNIFEDRRKDLYRL